MGYRVLDTDDVAPSDDRPCELRSLTEPANLDQMAINRFRAEPG